MKFFKNKLSRINFLILLSLITYISIQEPGSKNYINGIDKADPSVVNIYSNIKNNLNFFNQRNEGNLVGSGIIISKEGYIVTNFHVVQGNKEIKVELEQGLTFSARLIGFDQRSDLAVLKIDPAIELTPIEISDSENVRIGDNVIAIGNAFGLGKTVTSGIISATGRDYGNPYLELIQTDAAINPGNSGGALINHRGNLIGMNTKIFSKTGSYSGIGFALPANKMIEVASEIIKFGSVKRSWIGDFRVRPRRFLLNSKLTNGLEILDLKNYGPLFDESKIRQGNIIIKINGAQATWENLTRALNNSFPGDKITFETLDENRINFSEIKTVGMNS
ncbi:trypsin-like peptidase domain protein [SAR86 cluster bacterium SAR86E]|uniref:Trypsin-like peptidase domain protein n=1 Tax=SAR86 cluster bacterium SAR86E TaxID=1208365 RepID=K6GHG5_9GAMM|nr:trypsin-like peptidase domain protein [SAR86 cluster bacterium SAR86E]